jgi:hypothetical protein
METTENKKIKPLQAVILGIFIVAFFLNLGIMMMPLAGEYSKYSLMSLAAKITGSGITDGIVYSFALEIIFYVSILAIATAVISLFQKKELGFIFTIFYFLSYEVVILVFQAIYHCLNSGAIAIAVINIALALVSFVLLKFKKKNSENPAEEPTPNEKLISGLLLGFDVLGLLVLILAVFITPLYSVGTGSSLRTCTLGTVLFSTTAVMEDSIFFLVNLILVICCGLEFLSSLSSYFSDKKQFAKNSKNLLISELIVALEFFLLGYFIQFYYSFRGTKASSISYVPLVCLGALSIVFAILKGKLDAIENKDEIDLGGKTNKERWHKAEPLVYLMVVTAITVGSLFLNYIVVTFKSSTYGESIMLTGIKLLRDYASLGSAYQIVAFIIVAMLVSASAGFILTLTSYLAKYKYYENIAKTATYVNIFFIFVFGISGFYFAIAQQINIENTKKLIEYYNLTYNENYEYTMKTDTFYALMADIVVLIVMLIRKALDGKQQVIVAEAGSLPELPHEEKENKLPEENNKAPAEEAPLGEFDPCPAFTELDSKASLFKDDLVNRKKLEVSKTSLPELIKFVVDYAKDSRLHLSYSLADMATFVSGLGACRLTILQGMSGTGKTSLPKIFAEAIDANCDIVEVESSWKDKNELLGYYNEFSSTFTPKKFTQALYKAALNPEIPTFIVLDEMNLSRIEYYFSDFLSLMENEEGKREIKLLNIKLARTDQEGKHDYLALEEGHTIKIPSNIWFIGTANRDESTFVISDKVYDRAHTMNFNKRAPKVRDFTDPISQRFCTYQTLANLFIDAKKKRSFDAESNQTIKQVEALLTPYNISFGNRILNQIEDFVKIYEACFDGQDVQDQAVETILLSKVVSKLEVKTIENKDELAKEFESLNLLRCADFINKLNED